jgi:hypothetical protein
MDTDTSASSTSTNPAAPSDSAAPTATEAASPADPGTDDSRSSDPLKAERRKNNQLEKEIRTLRQQLNRFSEINPEEYSRPQETERQKQVLEERRELRERQMEEASAQRVAAVAAERDDAKQQVLQLRKDRLLERAFSQAEGRNGGDRRGTFFDIFKGHSAPASASAPTRRARTCSNPSMARANHPLVMSASELYQASFAVNGRTPSRRP